MSRNHESNTSSSSHAAIFRFLDAYENETYSDDDGALLGQLSMLRAGMSVEGDDEPRVAQSGELRGFGALTHRGWTNSFLVSGEDVWAPQK